MSAAGVALANRPGEDLRAEWADLLARRPSLGDSLALFGNLLSAWAQGPAPAVAPLAWPLEACAERWAAGVPLLAAAPPPLAREDVEPSIGAVLDSLAVLDDDDRAALARLAGAWDAGTIGPGDLLPDDEAIARLAMRAALRPALARFVAASAARPALRAYLAPCQAHATDGRWERGICPFCGGPPGFGELVEDGRRRLGCHACGGGWTFRRVGCPHCGTTASDDVVRLAAEGADEGWAVVACRACRAYLKELDRRVRWDAGGALVEDWGSPHLDLVAQRAGYWRPFPSLLDLAR